MDEKESAAFVQALAISKALRGDLRAIRDTLDRYEGTAVKRVESKTVYAQMSKKELAALAFQKLQDAGLIDKDGRPQEGRMLPDPKDKAG